MTIIAQINLVEFPSPQPDEPQPMSSNTLPVFGQQIFLDPPSGYKTISMAIIKLFNPRFAMPNPATYSDGPEFVHGNIHSAIRASDGTGYMYYYQTRVMTSPTMDLKAYNLLLRGNSNADDLTTIRTLTNLGVFNIVDTVNLNEASSTLMLAETTSQNRTDFWTLALDSLMSNLETDSSPQLGEECILHTWTMCGVVYAITNHGDIYKSTDAFLTNKQTVGSLGENIVRLHGGLIFAEPIGW